MTKMDRLTKDQALLLQRHIDANGAPGEEVTARKLLEEKGAARVYVAVLKELRLAVQMAIDEAVDQADFPDPQTWVELAMNSVEFSEYDLDELAPLLERFHDGEADAAEAATVVALIDHRDDVAAYLAELQGLSASIRQAHHVESADFTNFYDAIEAKLDDEPAVAEAINAFDPGEHGVLLHRFHDGEVTPQEERQVRAWTEAGDERVDALLGALADIHVGVNASIEFAREQAPLEEIWTGLDERLDAIDAERVADNVVTLKPRPATPSDVTPFWQRPIFAVAAAVVLLILGALIGPRMMQPEQVIEKRTVVIFDSVEYAPGSSVMIHSPELASQDGSQADIPILWVLEGEDPTAAASEEQVEAQERDESTLQRDNIPGPI